MGNSKASVLWGGGAGLLAVFGCAAPGIEVGPASGGADAMPTLVAPCAGPGSICTVVGNGEPAFTGEGEPVLATSLYWPVDLEFAPDGRGYVLDWQNHRVRRIDDDGRLRTVVGTDEIGDGPIPGTGSEVVPPGVPATSINLNHPTDVQFSADGATLMLAAWHNHKIRKIDLSSGLGQIACGRGPGFAGDGKPEAEALLNQPKSIAFGPGGDLYVLDTRNLRVRRIAAATGVIDTVIGSGTRGATGDGGDPREAQFSFQPDGDNPEPGGAIAVDADGRVYIADTQNHRVRRADLRLGSLETVAGDGTQGPGGDGGPALAAQLAFPRDLEIGPDGRLYVADTENQKIRVVDLQTGIIDTVAGSGRAGYDGDGGPAREAALQRPFGIAFDARGDLYVADTLNNRVRKVVRP